MRQEKTHPQHLTISPLSLDEAWEWVNREFPFTDYIPSARKDSYFEMPKTVSQWISKGASILEFGAGPCDKIAFVTHRL